LTATLRHFTGKDESVGRSGKVLDIYATSIDYDARLEAKVTA
jgi:hypothetical protein